MLFIKDHIRTDNAAALRTARHALCFHNETEVILLFAIDTVIAENRSMKFDRCSTSGHLMQIIDILRDRCLEFSLFLESDKRTMRLVGSGLRIQEFSSIKIVEFLGMGFKERMADDIYRAIRKAALLIKDTLSATEIGNPALSRHTCPAKENDILRFLNQLFQLLDLLLPSTLITIQPGLHSKSPSKS